jgi:hypothetical protein
METEIDYAAAGFDICQAKLHHAERYRDKADRPDYIIWNGIRVKTYDWWLVPSQGTVRVEFLFAKPGVEQGVDLKIEEGWVELPNGDQVPLLRTWVDSRFEDTVEYAYFTKVGRLCVWNVYKMHYAGGQIVEERWTGNAGFWVEKLADLQRVYHCSHGMAAKPDFDAFTFRVSILQTSEIGGR